METSTDCDTMSTAQLGSFVRSKIVQALAQSLEERRTLKQGIEDMASVCSGYRSQLQMVIDQRNFLYRDYAAMAGQMTSGCLASHNQTTKLLNEIAAVNAKVAVLEAQLCHVRPSGEREPTSVHEVLLRCKLDMVWCTRRRKHALVLLPHC